MKFCKKNKIIFLLSDSLWIFSMKNQLLNASVPFQGNPCLESLTFFLNFSTVHDMVFFFNFYKLDYILGLGCAFAVARCKINRLQGSTGGEKFKLKSYFSQHIENSLYVCRTQIMALFDNNLFCKSCFLVYYVQPFCE